MTLESSFIDEISTGVFALSSSYQFRYANSAAARLLGVPQEHLSELSTSINSLSPAFGRLLARVARGEFKSGSREALHITANAQYLSVAITISRAGDYIFEISPLQQQDISKSTHELKRPIQNIKALIEALMLGAKNDTAMLDRYLANISLESDRLSRLVTDMLKLNYLARGVIEPRKQEVLLAPMINKIFEAMAAKAKSKEIVLKSSLDDNATLVGDPELIEHMLENLIDNAIKYNHRGGSVRVEQDKVHSITIKDTGIGIPKADIERLGEEFYRASGSESIPGTGLGLSLVRSIVDLHSGTLEIESSQATGSVFTVRF